MLMQSMQIGGALIYGKLRLAYSIAAKYDISLVEYALIEYRVENLVWYSAAGMPGPYAEAISTCRDFAQELGNGNSHIVGQS